MERLKSESTIYHEIISDMSFPVCCFKPDGSITYKNQLFSDIYITSSNEESNLNFFDIINIRTNLEKLTPDFPIETCEHSFVGRDGQVSWYYCKNQAIFNPDHSDVIEYRYIAQDFTQYHEEIDKLKKISLRDELTGLYNRHYIIEELTRLDSERQKRPYSIIFCDVNDLKKVNDNSPEKHLAGDKLLKSTSKTIHKNCRDSDLVGRWGGDEFIIILPETTLKRAAIIRDRFLKSCQEKNISLATGIAQKEINENYPQVIDRADQEMYITKAKMKCATLSSI